MVQRLLVQSKVHEPGSGESGEFTESQLRGLFEEAREHVELETTRGRWRRRTSCLFDATCPGDRWLLPISFRQLREPQRHHRKESEQARLGAQDRLRAHQRDVLGRTIAIAELVKELKRDSSQWIKTKGPALADFYWQNGYGAFSVSPSHVESVRDYAANQEEHHRVTTFQDEFRRLLMKYGPEWDERYVWDRVDETPSGELIAAPGFPGSQGALCDPGLGDESPLGKREAGGSPCWLVHLCDFAI